MSEIFNKNLRIISKFEFTPNGWREIYVRDVCDIGRGRVISHEEIKSNPGPYPVYSSQTSNDGLMGSLDSYEFDSELITWTTDGANAGTVFFRQGKFNCTNVCGTLAAKSADDLDLKFLTYQIGRIAKHYVSYHGNPKLMNDVMGRVALVLPSKKAEQQRITEILSTIDDAIETTTALIHKYQQIKAGLMHDLFTRGLTADGKLRPPREQAPELYQETPLGWIPKEWKVVGIDEIADVIAPNPSHRNPIYHEFGYPFISTVEFLDSDEVEVDTPRRVIEEIVVEQERRCKFSPTSIAFSRKGTIAEIRFLPTGLRFALLDSLCVINPCSVVPSYLFHSLRSEYLKSQIRGMTMGQALPQMSIGRVRGLTVPSPANDIEQQEIGTRLDAIAHYISCATADKLKLQKQKSGLMHDLLTGKVPVTVRPEEVTHGS